MANEAARPRLTFRPVAAVEPVADERTLSILDFPLVLDRLAGHCGSPLGAEVARALRPSPHAAQVRADQAETDEARLLCDQAARPPLEGLHDVRAQVRRAGRGAALGAPEIWRVGEAAGCITRLRAFFAERAATHPRFWDWAEALADLGAIEAEVVRCLLSDGEVLDRASPALAAGRQRVRALEAAIRDRLDELVRRPSLQPALQEPLVTLRRDRFVLPVRADARAQVPGLVHDASATGATVFVEPMAVVELGNDLRAAQSAVAAEVARILEELSQLCGRDPDGFLHSLEVAGHLDFAVAKGRLSAEQEALAPALLPRPSLELHRARHPLLQRPVPVDIRVGADFDALVLTGPNTGGKTVCLKIAGLFACMAQAGLHLPCGAGSGSGVFPRVCGDAGDEQGVIQSLSTFSSHMRAVVAAVAAVRPGALVLLDELGAGTDPGEGAALAMALLEHLLQAGALTIVTTHYSELKAFAYRTERAENGSMSFDPETLAPTYRLVVGVPGGSQAFAIARRLGLPHVIVDRAAELQRPEERHVESMIAGMASDEQRLRDAAARAEAELRAAEALRAEWEARSAELEDRRREVLAAARDEASALVRRAGQDADAILRDLRRLADEAAHDLPASVTRAEEHRRRLRAAVAPFPSAGERPAAPARAFHAGQPVRIRSVGRRGVLLAAPQDGNAAVLAGSLRLQVPLHDLEPAPPEPEAPVRGGGARFGAAGQPVAPGAGGEHPLLRAFSVDLDLRGLRAGDALARVDKALDDAVLAGAPELRLIHGKGTGALREAVAEFLRGHPQVGSFRLGGAGEGGDGATVVAIRG